MVYGERRIVGGERERKREGEMEKENEKRHQIEVI